MGQMAGGGNGDFGGEASGGGNPWQKLLMGGLKGGLSGFSDMEKQNQMMRQGGGGGGGFQVPMAQQPNAQLPMGNQPFGAQPQRRGPNDLNFYGGSY